MSTSRRHLPLALGLVASGALILAALSAHSQPPPASAAPAGATGSVSAAAPAAPVPLRGADFPAETSDVPKNPEWDAARIVTATQDPKKLCTIKALRAWLRFECLHRIGAGLVAGDPAGVKVWGWGRPGAELPWASSKTLNEIPRVIFTLPLRRGEAKIFEIYKLDWTYEGYVWPEPAEKVSVSWREGAADPRIVVGRDPRGG